MASDKLLLTPFWRSSAYILRPTHCNVRPLITLLRAAVQAQPTKIGAQKLASSHTGLPQVCYTPLLMLCNCIYIYNLH